MHRNLGGWDRAIRAVVGVVVLFFVPWTPWAWLGLVPLLTALVGFCPLYTVFGWSTHHPPHAA